jgi:hypothetical protein
MGKDLAGKVVFITGATSGIGEETAKAFAARGAVVVASGRSADRLEALRGTLGGRTAVYRLDVRDEQAVRSVIDDVIRTLGGIDILVNNAGYGMFGDIGKMDLGAIEDMLDTNVMGVIRCTKAVLPHMLARRSGHIINIASIAGKVPTAKSAAYTATKHAVHGFTHALRMELRGSGVMVSAVNPGPVKTAFFTIADPSGQYLERVGKYAITADRVAKAIVRLAEKPRMEVDVPRFLGAGAQMYRAFPRLLDRMLHLLTDRK